ncbi:MAG: hypothetical protein R3B07_17345 [Polyangiaceae bacterium]
MLTKRNLPHLLDIYRFLREHGVQQVVFNVMQANGRADTYFEHIFPTYTETAREMRKFLDEAQKHESEVQAFLVDIPLCTTTEIPDFNRGYVESYVHYEPAANGEGLIPAEALLGRKAEHDGKDVVAITRGDLDGLMRQKRAECQTCRYEPRCEGVWVNYLSRNGWDEFVPVPEEAQPHEEAVPEDVESAAMSAE